MKDSYRYLIVASGEVRNLEDHLTKAVAELWGLRGLAEVGLSVVEVREREGLAIVRVKRGGLHLLRAAIAVYPVPLARVVKVTGTLKKARKILESARESAGSPSALT